MPKTGWVVKAVVLGLVFVVAQGCVSVGKYNDLKDNYRRLQEQLNDANSKLANAQTALDREKAVAEDLGQTVAELRKLGTLPKEVELTDEGLTIAAEVLFDSGKATLKRHGKEVLGKVAKAIKQAGLNVRIDGHTDSDPIKRSGWASNHHLSAARALSVYQEFVKNGLSSSKIHVVGWGPNRPRASNATASGKAKNRRVEIKPYKPESLPPIAPIEAAPLKPKKRVEPNPKT
ncbi:MAG: OmpA family protein [Planctomycetes bacterium]|nr:OmpA family protein [Planctomycetota bacterium]